MSGLAFASAPRPSLPMRFLIAALAWGAVAGLWLAWQGGWYVSGWFHAKFTLVLILSGVHGFFTARVRDFAIDANTRSQKFYRIINEVPTVLMIGIVILVIVKPF